MISAAAGLSGAAIGAVSSWQVARHTAGEARDAETQRRLVEKRAEVYHRFFTDVLEHQWMRRKQVEQLDQGEMIMLRRDEHAPTNHPVPRDALSFEAEVRIYGQDEVKALVTALKNAEWDASRALAQWSRFAPMPPALVPMFSQGKRKSQVVADARAAIARADSAVTALQDKITAELA